MRFLYLLILVAPIFLACNSKSVEYDLKPVKTSSILVRGQLTGIIDSQKLELNLALINLLNKKLQIKEIYISTTDSIKSILPLINQKSYSLTAYQDTTLSLLFYPVNDKILYQNTDIRGLLKSSYNISVIYSIEGRDERRIIELIGNLKNTTYQNYKNSHHEQIQVFQVDKAIQFTNRLSSHLNQQKLTINPAFVHLSNQEIAVAGLNFRVKAFQKNDSLYAKISIVNHSGFSIKIDTNKLDFKFTELNNHKQILLKKVTGSKDEFDIIRKGERMIVSITKHQKQWLERNMSLGFKNTFLLPNGKSLFLDDVKLVRIPLENQY
jgi:hypothetical protein